LLKLKHPYNSKPIVLLRAGLRSFLAFYSVMAHYSYQNINNNNKPIGMYLVEAGLLSEAQVGVALADQDVTSMLFGEILVTRGWVKAQTIEYLMQKIVLPERAAAKLSFSDLESSLIRQKPKSTYTPGEHGGSLQGSRRSNSREAPSPSKEDGVNWIG
jgi:hypothetical protein